MTRPWRLVAAIALVVALAGCSGTQAEPQLAATADAESIAAGVDTGGDGSSASARSHLAQLLTASPPALGTASASTGTTTAPVPSGPPYSTGPRPGSPVITPPPALPPGDGTVYAVGDSVLLGTKDYLGTTLGPGWDLRLDGRVGRRFREGLDVFRENHASLGQVAVVILGHNDGDGKRAPGYLDELMAELRPVQRVVVVTLAEWSPSQPLFNRAIRDLPGRYGNVVVADWAAVTAANPQFLIADRVHLTRAGAIALSNLIAVMVGPAPQKDGRVPPPPRILPIPDAPDPAPAPIGQPIPTLTTTTTGVTTTTAPTSSTSTSTSTTSPSTSSTSTSTPTTTASTTTAPNGNDGP